ncbi:MAG: exosortase/archaeosortase family protein [Pirellulaceae bacterium]|nr:exosortase/archaeosortase family protein [Pirellulaceae bacterium]
MNQPYSPLQQNSSRPRTQVSEIEERNNWLILGGMVLGLILLFLQTLGEIAQSWEEPQYSHGYLIPVLSGILLWFRREPFLAVFTWERWLGAAILFGSFIAWYLGTYLTNFTLERLAFIPTLLGCMVMVGGVRSLLWSAPPILFLVFMIPWPDFLVQMVLNNLQSLATTASYFFMQVLGIDCFREGHIILLDNIKMNVEEQCSGLRMLTVFVALSVAMAMFTRERPLWEKVTLVASSLPIALFVNTLRITTIGVFYNAGFEPEWVNSVLHDQAGLFMMPIALGLMYIEIQILARIFIEESAASSLQAGVSAVAKSSP